uniref:Uncharacterized protein n=1 Tax=Cacopsylla melanoneura TaxID=428564 RepID=A0A8D8UPU5_9HEMI
MLTYFCIIYEVAYCRILGGKKTIILTWFYLTHCVRSIKHELGLFFGLPRPILPSTLTQNVPFCSILLAFDQVQNLVNIPETTAVILINFINFCILYVNVN